MDFTPQIYKSLVQSLLDAGYRFQTFEEMLSRPVDGKVVVLRHDIDKLPYNAITLGEIEHDLGVKATYYIRIVKATWNEDVIKQLIRLGHEVSYHYEDLTITRGDYEKAWAHFKKHFDRIRAFYPAKTVCMHGSPLSKWDNRKLWEKYDYRELDIIGEPYFDVDYTKMLYVTDTGRSWNKSEVSVRDKVPGGLQVNIKSTDHFIRLVKDNALPDRIMINTHPQRWFPFGAGWMKELVFQNIKNLGKRGLMVLRAERNLSGRASLLTREDLTG